MSNDLKRLIERLNPVCKAAMEQAARRAVSQTNHSVEIEHLFAELLKTPNTDLRAILRHYDIDPGTLTTELDEAIETFARGAGRTPSLAPQLPDLLRAAWLASSVDHSQRMIRSATLFQALVRDAALNALVSERVPSLGQVDPNRIVGDIGFVLDHTIEAEGSTAPQPTATPTPTEAVTDAAAKAGKEAAGKRKTATQLLREGRGEQSALDQFTMDLTEQARAGKLDIVIGRDQEVAQAADVLMRRRQNNPCLVGEPGVGKTAIVEGLALRIAAGQVPEALKGIQLRQLDLGQLQAGAGVRGEFEQRLKQLLKEISQQPEPMILFVDEVHTLIGSGGQEGTGDAANLLKPALARGELRLIGATTWREYKKYIEKDPALARRLQPVRVEEPSIPETCAMLRGLAPTLEQHHNVRIENAAIEIAAKLAARYITGRQLPDKAVSVLDTACARVALSQASEPPSVSALNRDWMMIEAEEKRLKREEKFGADHSERLAELSDRRDELGVEREKLLGQAAEEGQLIEEIVLIEGEIAKKDDEGKSADRKTVDRLMELRQKLAAVQGAKRLRQAHVDSGAVAGVIAGWTGVPVDQILSGSLEAARDLEGRLGERVIGQPQGIGEIARRIQAASAQVTDPNKPTGVFLMIGPTGTGKTETAATLADLMFGGREHMITINMTEYQEGHSVAGLKGAPPGYVGYGTGGVLTEAVRRAPYSVVLLDEFEKAHPDVLELFYQVFDEGRLEDSEGQRVNFRNTIIIATSNAGEDVIETMCAQGRPDPQTVLAAVDETLREFFPAALLGRMTVIPYYPLVGDDVETIARIKLRTVTKRVTEAHNADCDMTDAAVRAIREAAAREAGAGARSLDRIINNRVLPVLSTEILARMGDGRAIEHLVIDFAEEDFVVRDVSEAPATAEKPAAKKPAAKKAPARKTKAKAAEETGDDPVQ